MFLAAEDFQRPHLVEGRLDTQDVSELVVHLERIAAHAVLDPHTLRAVLQVAGDFLGEAGMESALRRNLMSQEA